ncbi:MAG: hypothetical protein E7006_00020 [Alphaproteobacteria bacterium]|nr:hypothetical protein [Alphaproteobacteria bacterium]
MKRFVAVLSGLLVLPAFAEVAPLNYDDVIEYEESAVVDEDVASDADVSDVAAPVVQPSAVNPRGVSGGRTAATRAMPSATSSAAASRSVAAGRVVSSGRSGANVATSRDATVGRSTVARSATARTAAPRATVARSAAPASTSAAGQIASTRREMQTSAPTTAARASVLQASGASLYSGNRVSTRASAIRARAPVTTSISASVTEGEDVADTQTMDEIAQLTDFCKAQYTSCMDNYCNVLDDNQGRCSCSKNIKNYEKTENALKAATEALQDVAQQIQYIGLTKQQIETIFAQTEAEEAMSYTTDTTQLKNDLDRIKDLIVEVKPGSASTTATTSGLSMDLSGLLDFNIDNTGFDLSALFGNTNSNTNSISNQRGEQLYKTAAARCKATVLNNCTAQGVDATLITNAYDLEIDKQCLVYERSLNEANDNMNSTVRNAKNVLQRARLMVEQNKNTYDLRGCINALDSCMQDEYVCGTDYEYCLDPSNTYIVNGEIVVGSTPGQSGVITTGTGTSTKLVSGLYKDSWQISGKEESAWSTTGSGQGLTSFVTAYLNNSLPEKVPNESDGIIQYLIYKIGYIKDGKPYGMCASVLNQCQDYTYVDKEYVQRNRVIESYLERVMIQIKAAQDAILADYAENCISDVTECLSDAGYNNANNGQYLNPSAQAVNACKGIITTCMSTTEGSAFNGNANAVGTNVQKWLDGTIGSSYTKYGACVRSGGTWTGSSDSGSCKCASGTADTNTGRCPSGSSK